MFAQSCSVVRRTQQCMSFLRRMNICTGQREIELLSSENRQKLPVFLSENLRRFSGNGVVPRTLVHLHLQTGFRCFSADSQYSADDVFSELDAKEINEDMASKGGSEVNISSESESISLLFKEAISLEGRSESKIQKLEIEDLSDLPLEGQVEKLKNMLESQWEILNTLTDSVDGLENQIKELKSKAASLENTNNQLTENFVEFKKRLRQSINTVIDENVESEQANPKKVKKVKKVKKIKKKVEGVSGTLEHPWPEWVRFLEHLNERGYLSRALNFPWGQLELEGLKTEEIYRFIKFAAVSFAKDHVEISKLPENDLRKVALYCVPSVEKKVVDAANILRSFYSTEDIASLPSDVEDTRELTSEDVARVLCAYGLNAEKSEPPIPDEIKESVVRLLKEFVDVSASSVNDG